MDHIERMHLAVGLAITSRRVEAGLSQEALAARAGVDRVYYGRLERGRTGLITLEVLLKVADAFSTLPETLLSEARARLDDVAADGTVEREILKPGRRARAPSED